MTPRWYESLHGKRIHRVPQAPGPALCGVRIGHPLSYVLDPPEDRMCRACLREMAKREAKP